MQEYIPFLRRVKVGIFPRFIYKSNKLLWKLFRPTTVGVRVILAKADRVLLVKHTYLDNWYLPGGKVNKGETFEQALRRELKEELGAELLQISLHGVYSSFAEYKNDQIVIFYCNEFSVSGKTDSEIEQYEFFDLNQLPDKISPATKRRLDEYYAGKTGNFGLW